MTIRERTVPSQTASEESLQQVLRIEPSGSGFSPGLAGVWDYRELLYFLVWRDLLPVYDGSPVFQFDHTP